MKFNNRYITLILVLTTCTLAWGQITYQRPPDVIADLVLAKPTPIVSLSPDGEKMMLMQRNGLPGLEELAKEELRIAGLRINPANHSQSRSIPYNHVSIQTIAEDDAIALSGVPDDPLFVSVSWAPDGKHIAFTLDERTGLSLWVASVDDGVARKVSNHRINGAMRGTPFMWADGGSSLVYKTVADGIEMPAGKEALPEGPVVQESSGQDAAIRTYQDLLKNPEDEQMFEYFASANLYRYDVGTGQSSALIDSPALIMGMSQSPSGEYLLIATLHRPFSYLVPYYRFPIKYSIHDRDGGLVSVFAEIPLAEEIPKGFDAVRMGPRSVDWRSDSDATLYWAEAVDEGNPRNEVDVRDHVYSLAAPFDETPMLEAKCGLRYGGISFGDDQNAFIYERMWSTRQTITSHFKPGDPMSKKVLFDRSSEDRYSDPGSFVMERTESGDYVVRIEDGHVYMSGTGASPEGNRPFLRKMSLESLEQEELWRSEAPYYERAVSFHHLDEGKIITRREAVEEQPNYYMLDLKSGKREAITHFEHPYPQLLGVHKEELKFKRADGIDMTGDLYLPKGYDAERDGPLPTLMWAYPREYKSAKAAGQVSGSPYTFTRVNYGSPVFWVTRGYAVLANASMPIVGEEENEPNDSFREQLVMNAEAAIDALVSKGVCDPDRVAIGGHSYGAFMTANLLAHSDLFAAGIARSGAYNRTLTPFGFQREERTYWDAPEIYYTMSPFMHADKVNEPILMIHGEADNNSGTFPMQSKRFYSAIKGLGGTARLVMLPYESHGYRAEESILHMLWEQDQWLEKYVKNRKQAGADKSD